MNKLAYRYAQALYELSTSEKCEDQLLKELKMIQTLYEENPGLNPLLAQSQVSKDEKKKLLDELFGWAHPYILNTLKLLVDKQRTQITVDCCKAYRDLYNDAHNIIQGIAFTTIPLSDSELQTLEKELSDKEHKTIQLVNRLDPTLVKGIKIRYGDKILDASLKARIEGLRNCLIEGRS